MNYVNEFGRKVFLQIFEYYFAKYVEKMWLLKKMLKSFTKLESQGSSSSESLKN